MLTNSHQTGTLEVPHVARPIKFRLSMGWLIAGLAVAGLLGGLIWSDNLVRYPGAQRQAAAQFELRFQPSANLSQQSAYQTPDDLPQVMGWYAQNLGLSHDMPQGDNCVTMTRVDTRLSLQQPLFVTLCAHPTRTLIFINRSLLSLR